MTGLRELKFINADATPRECVLHVSTTSIAPIMDWYGSFYAGDTYRVFVDGKRVKVDQNGGLIGTPFHASPVTTPKESK